MNVYEAIKIRRTVRKYKPVPVKNEDLIKMIECARLAPTGANLQSLKYSIIADEEKRREIYPFVKYAGYIPDWDPSFEESPMAFIAVLNDTDIKQSPKAEADSGGAIMSMCLMAKELGLDTCWLGSVNRDEVKKIMGYADNLDILYLLAVGYGDQTGEFFDSDKEIKYYFTKDGDVRVPKRTIDNIIV